MEPLWAEYPIPAIILEMKQLLCGTNEGHLLKESPRKVVSFLSSLGALFTQLGLRAASGNSSSSLSSTSLKGFLIDLRQLKGLLLLCHSKSRLYQLVHCRGLNDMLTTMIHKLAQSLSLIAMDLHMDSELHSSFVDVVAEMNNTRLKVSDLEDYIITAIEEQLKNGIDHSSNDALIINIARELGMTNGQLCMQIGLYKKDIQDSTSPRDDQIADLLERLLVNQSNTLEPVAPPVLHMRGTAEEEKPIPPFKTFICPLSKEVMRNPVIILQTSQTYEQSEIEKWFRCCAQESRQFTCPMTGQVLTTAMWRRDLVLQTIIEEWNDRNFRIRISGAKRKLSMNASAKDFEDAVVEVHKISEESMEHRHTLRKEGIISLLLGPWHGPLEYGHFLRHKVLVALYSMALQNEENKLKMADEDVVRYAVKSLTSLDNEEKESAARLLCELSTQREISAKIGNQKGAILLLTGLVNNGESATLAGLADQTLRNLQEEQSNVIPMAEAGTLEPLLDSLCKGPPDVKLEMVTHLTRMILSNSDKEIVIKQAGPILVGLLSHEDGDKEAILQLLLMLSTPGDNGHLLIDHDILLPLFSFISSRQTFSDTLCTQLREKAVEILSNLLSKTGDWEFKAILPDGSTLHSESAIHFLLGLLPRTGFRSKLSLLRVLYSICTSPHTAEAAASHIQSGNGIAILSLCLQESDGELHLQALKVLGALSQRKEWKGAEELRKMNQIEQLKRLLLRVSDPEKQGLAALILSRVPMGDTEIVEALGIELVPWIIHELSNSKGIRLHGGTMVSLNLMEGLLNLLLQFCKCSDKRILEALREHRLVMVFKQYIVSSLQASVKKLAAEGLRMLSENAAVAVNDDKSPPWNCCLGLFGRRQNPAHAASCSVHGLACKEGRSFCLVRADAVRPLVDVLENEDDDTGVRAAAVGALSTLLRDENNLNGGTEELAKADGVHKIIQLFCSGQTGELQDQLVWMIEKITRVEELCQRYAIDQVLFKMLVQAFRSGNPETRTKSQMALTNLKQISGMVAS